MTNLTEVTSQPLVVAALHILLPVKERQLDQPVNNIHHELVCMTCRE